MDFKKWYEEYADMPKKDLNGIWYDAETGLAFDQNEAKKFKKEVYAKEWQIGKEARKSKGYARKFGAKLLIGSLEEVARAEVIRAQMIQDLSSKDAKYLVTHDLTQEAKFYIENQEISAQEVVEKL